MKQPYPANWPARAVYPTGDCPQIDGTYKNAGVWASTGNTIALTQLLVPPGPTASDAADVTLRLVNKLLLVDANSPTRGTVHAELRVSSNCAAGQLEISAPPPGEIEGMVTTSARLRILMARDNSLIVRASRTNVGLLVYTEKLEDWSRFESRNARSNKSLERSRER